MKQMNNLFLENKRYFYLFLSLFIIALLAFYFLFFRPTSQENEDKKASYLKLEEEIALISASEENETLDESMLDDLKLLEKVPKSYELEQFLLTLNEIELVSDSRFVGLEMSYDDALPKLAEEDEAEETGESEDSEEENSDEEETKEDEAGVSDEADENVLFTFEDQPENMHVMTAHITVASPNYKAFKKLLEEIESQDRIMFVNGMNFIKPAEKELVIEDSSNESIYFTADITTFYYSED